MSIAGTFMVPHPPLIIPEVGRGQEQGISSTVQAYEKIGREIAALKPETIIVTTPHSIMYADYFHISPGKRAGGGFERFGAGQVRIETEYDTEFVRELCQRAEDAGIMAGTMGEREKQLDHGFMIPLYFVDKYYRDYRTVRIGLSGLAFSEHYRLGMCIRDTAEYLGRSTVVIASGDLSHKLKKEGPYGFAPEGVEYDRRLMDVMGRAEFGELLDFSEEFCERAAECGHRSFVIMAGTLDGMAVVPEILSHEGPFGVGYGCGIFRAAGRDDNRRYLEGYSQKKAEEMRKRRQSEDAYMALARKSLETFVREGRLIKLPEGLPEELLQKSSGVFVSLKKDGKLRGCIGTVTGVRSCLGEEIMENAVSAGTRDPRFPEVREEELEEIVYSVDVLTEPCTVDSEEELDAEKHGVIVRNGWRQGLLLPDLEGVDTVEEQISIARRKAGIGPEEPVELKRFEVVRHSG